MAVSVVLVSVLLAACSSAPNLAAPSPRPITAPVAKLGASPEDRAQGIAGSKSPEFAAARRIVARMPLSHKAGQVIVAEFGGIDTPRDLVRKHHVGGVIVMGYNVNSARQVRRVNLELQKEQRASGRSWPLQVGVDQEGGEITRIGAPLTEFPSYLSLGAARSPRLAAEVARASGRELRALGFTTVFAPVADITVGPKDMAIASRAAGSDPKLVGDIVAGSLRGYAEAGLIAVPKHFPGHGSVGEGSHLRDSENVRPRLPVQRSSMLGLERRDLRPFRTAIASDAPAMMVGHLDVRALDKRTPASLSPRVVNDLLRKKLGFDGVIMTDSLQMGAIVEHYQGGTASVRALRAGADVVLMPVNVAATKRAIVRAVNSGELSEARLDEAATRVIAMQLRQAASPLPFSEVGQARSIAYAESLAALTVVSGPCSDRLVGKQVKVIGGKESDRRLFGEAASAAGLGVGATGDVVRLLGSGGASGKGSVVVSLASPYGLGVSQASKAKLALYGRTPESFRALVDVLLGKVRGRGRLPVKVPGVDPSVGC